MTRFVFAVLMLLTAGSFAQNTTLDPATGNLVYTTVNPAPAGADAHSWSGFETTTSNGGGFSGGWQPAYNPNTGTFMFGYNQGTVAYTTAVNQALAIAGTGIQVKGLKYSWEYYNQDMSRGTLTGNISLTSNTGQTLQSYNYNMPQTTTGWTKMSGTENFSTLYAPSSLGSLNVSFTGKDDRWWAGYYGPQIRDIGVNLLFSVATPPPIPTDFLRWVRLADENGEFTLTKPGVVRYGAQDSYIYRSFEPGTYSCSNGAWGNDPIGGVYKSCSLGSNTTTTTPTVPTTNTNTITTVVVEPTTLLEPVTTTTTTTTASPTSTVTDPVAAVSSTSTAATNNTSQPGAVASVVSAPAPATTSSNASTSSSSTTASAAQATRESSQSGGSNVGLALSIISRNQERDAAGAAVAASAVSQAQQAAQSAQQEAAAVATAAVANSTANNAVASVGSVGGPGFRVNTAAVVNTASQTSTVQNLPGVAAVSAMGPQSQTVSTSAVAPIASVGSTSVAPTQSLITTGTGSSVVETNVAMPSNFLTDRTNPINAIIEQRLSLPNTVAATTGPSVNTRASDNEAAAGVNIATMAVAPIGYGDYLNLTLRDAAFYAPREVYRNQRNVDNQRALRQLTNDSRHRDMVEQQYRR